MTDACRAWYRAVQPRRVGTAMLSAVLLVSVAPSTRAGETPRVHVVVIQGVAYQPQSLTVKRGERVRWINDDPFPHTVTAHGVFDSHSIAAGGSWTYVTRKAGSYPYVCSLHSNMQGTLEVQ